jgi:hypothetical protein
VISRPSETIISRYLGRATGKMKSHFLTENATQQNIFLEPKLIVAFYSKHIDKRISSH